MKIISHRGNLIGREPQKENNPSYIQAAIQAGYEVEIDVWCVDGNLYLGHDSPDYLTDINFLKNSRLWCHAKNTEAFSYMLQNGIRCFWHETDTYTLTSFGEVWCYLWVKHPVGITVYPEPPPTYGWENTYGVCTDYPVAWKERFEL